jgi:hypothetical protein
MQGLKQCRFKLIDFVAFPKVSLHGFGTMLSSFLERPHIPTIIDYSRHNKAHQTVENAFILEIQKKKRR